MDSLLAWSARLLYSEPTLRTQLLETLLLAAAFGIIMPAATRYFSRSFKSRPWYDRVAALLRDQGEKMLKIKITQPMVDKGMGQYVPMLSQHFVGGFLCMPAVFGLGVPRAVALAMARHGALVELGWELQDTAERLYERFFAEDGEALQPNGLFFFLMMHHGMQWALVIPMNLYYSELSGYHELIFMLEGAAGFALLVQFYSYTLDMTKRSELRWMIILNAFNFTVMLYSRLIHYWWSVYKCLRHFYLEESYAVLAIGVICSCLLMPYIAINLLPALWQKLCKFVQEYMAQGAQDRSSECELPALIKNVGQGSTPFKGEAKAHLE